MNKIRRTARAFNTMSIAEMRLVVETCAESAWATIVLKSPWWRMLIKTEPPLHADARIQESNITEVAALVVRTTRALPWSITCLQQSIALQRILLRRGVFAPLVIGARHTQDDQIAAHAWLEHPALPQDLQSDAFHRLDHSSTAEQQVAVKD